MIEPLQIITILGLGFILGIKHALEADHVIAISTLVHKSKNLKQSSLLGAIWGVGHTATLLIVGAILLIFKLSIPPKLTLIFEGIVGIILIILGIDLLRKINQKIDQKNKHSQKCNKIIPTHHHKSFIVGMFHGLAGSAALTLLVLTTVNSFIQGLLYILLFGFGSIIGMLSIGGIISLPFLLTIKSKNMHQKIKIIAGIVSIIVGLIMISQISVIKHLLI